MERSFVYLVFGVFVLLCGCDAAIYYGNQTLKQWCDPNPVIKAVLRIIKQPKDLFVARENPLQIIHRWDSTYGAADCEFTVESERGTGLVLNVNQMFLRPEWPEYRDPLHGECIDYFRIKFTNGTKTKKMCGQVNATAITSPSMMTRSFVVPDGKAEIKIRLDYLRNLRSREHLYVDFLFTQYDDCRRPNSFQCAEEMCIHQKYVNDGNVNCPYTNCLDETSCNNKTTAIPPPGNSKRAIIGGVAAAVVLAVLVPISICCCCEFCRKGAVSRGRSRSRSSGPTSGGGGSGESRSTSSSGGGGRRQRHRTNRGVGRGAEGIRQDTGANRPQSIAFTAIVTTGGVVSLEQAPPADEHKESPPPTYESIFPDRR